MPLLHSRTSTTTSSSREPSGDDAVLVAAAQRDPHAFEPLFRRYWNSVLRYCLLRLEAAEAEDAASDIFVNAYAALPRFRERGEAGTFRSWLFTIAHHEVASRRRSRLRHPEHHWTDELDRVPDGRSSLEDEALRASERDLLLTAIRQLPARSREVVELRLAGLADREIADVLGIRGEAVRQAQSRGVAQLRAWYRSQSDRKRNDDA
ncbi:MAG: RNA polymerase sigma factor [Thermomicrobiales bacterium]